uniref:MHC class I-like antigen recognition-like domain-containing protein n=1 Tax=Naja naja TaxID=35670 RepID=A0A8C6VBD1_NAJNA
MWAEPPPNSALLPPPSLGSPSHSLSYFYLHLPEPSQGLPQFSIRSYLDNQPITRFDSLTRKMEPLVPWMEEMEKERFLAPEWVFRADLEKLSKLEHQVGGEQSQGHQCLLERKEDPNPHP